MVQRPQRGAGLALLAVRGTPGRVGARTRSPCERPLRREAAVGGAARELQRDDRGRVEAELEVNREGPGLVIGHATPGALPPHHRHDARAEAHRKGAGVEGAEGVDRGLERQQL